MADTQRVTLEIEIGAGKFCGPCNMASWKENTVRKGAECMLFEFASLEPCPQGGTLRLARCKSCLAKWPVKGGGE